MSLPKFCRSSICVITIVKFSNSPVQNVFNFPQWTSMDFCKVEFNYFLEFAKLRALRAFVSYVPSRLTRLRALRAFVPSRLCALRAFAPYVPWFLHALLTRFAHLICYLSALLTRDVHSSQVVSVFSESIISMNLCLLLLYLSSLSLFNRDLNRGCLVYMFLCVFQEVNFW